MDEEQVVATQDEENEENEAPRQPAQEEPEKDSPEEPEQQPEKVEKPEQNEEVADEEPADYYADYLKQTQPGQLPELKFSDDGSIPVDELQGWGKSVIDNARNEAARQFAEMREEDRQWQRVFDKYPEISKNKRLRDLVHKQRIGNVLAGGKNDVMSAAKDIFALREEGQKTGAQSAKESIVRQKSADLETASTVDSEAGSSDTRRLLDLSAARSKKVADAARTELLKKMIDSGQV